MRQVLKGIHKRSLLNLVLLVVLLVSSSCSSSDLRFASGGGEAVKIETKNSWSEETATLESGIPEFEFPYFSSSRYPLIAEDLNENVNRIISDYFAPIVNGEYELGDYPEFSLEAS